MDKHTQGGWILRLVGILFLASVISSLQLALAQATPTQIEATIDLLRPGAAATALGQSATLLPDGRWLLLGGVDADHKPVAAGTVLDARSGQSVALSDPPTFARSGHTATVLPDGTVLILGGEGADGHIVSTPEVFDPKTQTFQSEADFDLLPRQLHTATLLTDGRLLIVGGLDEAGNVRADIELLDTRTGAVERFDYGLETARFGHLAALLPSAPVLVWRGLDSTDRPATSAELFEPQSNSFGPIDGPKQGYLPDPLARFATPAVTGAYPDPTSAIATDARLSLRFSKPLDVTTLTAATVTLFGPNGPIPVDVVPAEAGMLLFVTPNTQLTPWSHFTLFVNGASDATAYALPFTAIGFVTGGAGAARTNNSVELRSAEAMPTAKVSNTTLQQSSSNDLWVPGPAQFNGRWTLGLPKPVQEKALRTAADGVTAIAGEVRQLNGAPLAGVTLRAGAIETTSDSDGQFLLSNVGSGGQVMRVDARTANRGASKYGIYMVHVEVQSGQTNVLPYTIWMSELDPKGYVEIPSPTVAETVVTSPRIPGLELRIPAGTVIRDADGNIVTEINITAIPTDRPPFPLPDFSVPVYFTIQPGGAWLQGITAAAAQGARLIYPNFAREVPNALAAFWNYDARDKGWYVYGMGKVGADGQQVVPDQGVVVYDFSGAMINNDPPPSPGPKPCNALCCGPPDPPPPGGGGGSGDWTKNPDGGNSGCDGGGDPVSLSTGQFTHTERDFWLPDVMPLDIKRTYRAFDLNVRSFGVGMSHPYNMFLWSAQQYQQADLILPSGSRVHYVRTSPGTGFGDAVFTSQAPGQWAGSTIAWNGDGWNLVFRDGRIWVFGVDAPMQAMIDRNGNKTAITHSAGQGGVVTRIDSPNGRWITFTYNGSNLVSAATDCGGRTFTYAYDANNQLTNVTDPLGGVRVYTWNAQHRLESIKDPDGNVIVQNVYDGNARATQQTEADGSQFTYAYTLDANGNVTQTNLTDRRGNVRQVLLDENGYITSDTFPLGKPEQQVTTFTNDGNGWLQSKTDALGRTTTYTYDALGNRLSVTVLSGTANAVTASFTYTPTFNGVATATDPLGHVTTFRYDAAGNLTNVKDANGNSRSFTYDGQGRALKLTDGLGHARTITYNGPDLATFTDALGRTTSLFSDAVGRLESNQDPMGNRHIVYYDSLNRTTSETDPLGDTVAYTYDPNGKLLTLTDPRGGVTTYTYNKQSMAASRKDALNNTETYAYDIAGKLSQLTDRKGQVQGLTYDNMNRRTQIGFGATVANPTTYQTTIGYTYDAGNRVTQIADSINGTITRTYDDLDRLAQEQTPQGTLTYTYDVAGRRTTMTVTGQPTTTYSYDNGNRLTQITRGSETIRFAYDAADRRTQTTLSNGVVVSYGYDIGNQLTSITYQKGASTIGALTYTYDKGGRRVGVGGSLAQVNIPQAIAIAVYNANNQLTSWAGQSYIYDLNGNLTSDGQRTYEWNVRDELTSLTGSVTASFQYDAFGRRQSKTVSGTSTQFLYDGLNFVQELSGGTPNANIITGSDLTPVLSRTAGGNSSSFLSDAAGSTIALADNTGAIATSYAYEPYGAVTQTGTANTNTQKFGATEDDGTGLLFYRARYYIAVCGRFASEDKRFGLPNLYGLNGANPIGAFGAGAMGSSALGPMSTPSGSGPGGGKQGGGGGGGWGEGFCEAMGAVGSLIGKAFDYGVITIPIGEGFGIQITVDEFGRVYWGGNFGVGWPEFGFGVGFFPPPVGDPGSSDPLPDFQDALADSLTGLNVTIFQTPLGGLQWTPNGGFDAGMFGTFGIGVSYSSGAYCAK